MKRLTAAILALFTAIACFFAGFLVRQPSINKLKKQVKRLQAENKRLTDLQLTLSKELSDLLAQVKALKVFDFKHRADCNEKIRQNLTFQYALFEYLRLLLDRVRDQIEMSDEEMKFFKAYEKVIDGKNLGNGDKDTIQNYITSKYATEIKQQKECNLSQAIEMLRNQ